jgi:hypothetical protein
MMTIDCKQKANAVREAYTNLILNASVEDLLCLAREDVEVNAVVWSEDDVKVNFSFENTAESSPDQAQFDLYLETPKHTLPIATDEFHVDLAGCSNWLDENGVTSLDLKRLNFDLPLDELDREIEFLLFSDANVIEALKAEMLYELDEFFDDLDLIIELNIIHTPELSTQFAVLEPQSAEYDIDF